MNFKSATFTFVTYPSLRHGELASPHQDSKNWSGADL